MLEIRFFSVLVRGYMRPPARYSPRRGRRRSRRSRRSAIAGKRINSRRKHQRPLGQLRRPMSPAAISRRRRSRVARRRAATGLDVWLTLRMLAVGGVLGLAYAALAVAAVAIAVDHFASHPLLVLVPVTLGWFLFVHMTTADHLALKAAHAKHVFSEEEPELCELVRRLSIVADIKPPRVAISRLRAPNSLAVGLLPSRRTVVVTEALRERLTPHELEAVLAHELSHLANRDAFVLTAASFYRVIAGFFGDPTLTHPDETPPKHPAMPIGRVLFAPLRWALLGIGSALTLSLSRYREYAADRGAAMLTGSPESLISALTKLGPANRRIPSRDLRRLGAAHPFLLLPVVFKRWGLLSDHPPLDKRIARLQRLAADS
jgi:heat shock protein HtpX